MLTKRQFNTVNYSEMSMCRKVRGTLSLTNSKLRDKRCPKGFNLNNPR
jgi:hypothetical protein